MDLFTDREVEVDRLCASLAPQSSDMEDLLRSFNSELKGKVHTLLPITMFSEIAVAISM